MFKTLLKQLGELKKIQKIVVNLLAKIRSGTVQCVRCFILCQRAKSTPTTHVGNYFEAHSIRQIE